MSTQDSKKSKRKGIPKKVRFEVLKRDSFIIDLGGYT